MRFMSNIFRPDRKCFQSFKVSKKLVKHVFSTQDMYYQKGAEAHKTTETQILCPPLFSEKAGDENPGMDSLITNDQDVYSTF